MNSDMLSQEEINALLQAASDENSAFESDFDETDETIAGNPFGESDSVQNALSELEKDAIGEIGNISMGTAATTLSTLLNRKVNITTPNVGITSASELAEKYSLPFVAVDVGYREGLEGSNVLILDTKDVKIITDLMMGKTEFDTERELSDIDLSAVSEAMNQMMGSTATSLSEMFNKKIDISPPQSLEVTFQESKEKLTVLASDSPLVSISFRMVIGDLIDSNFMQLIPIDFAHQMVDILLGTSEESVSVTTTEPISSASSPEVPVSHGTRKDISETNHKPISDPNHFYETPRYQPSEEKVMIRQPNFNNFTKEDSRRQAETIDLVGDIPVELTVELGRTNKRIGEILEFSQGTVIELDRLVGESLDIYANGRFIAKGEVVVIEDNFGVRVTEIEKDKKYISR